MVGIRSITYHLPQYFSETTFELIRKGIVFWKNNYPFVRTFRINAFPFTQPNIEAVKKISFYGNEVGVRWFNIPISPLAAESQKSLFTFAYNLLRDYNNVFVHIIGVEENKIDFKLLNHTAELIKETSRINFNGQDNFRLGFSTNVKPNGPFFPFTMSSGEFGFSIALELTQEINLVIKNNPNAHLTNLRNIILSTLSPQIEKINALASKIEKETGITFQGFDFSLAPIIEDNGSIVPILKRIGIDNIGKSGSMFATAYLTNILKFFASKYKSVGFSGVMYSLLEDIELCRMNNNENISLQRLISLSTMCGCGVDMVPVYGTVTKNELLSIFLDVITISLRLNKPLGVRILPIPTTKNYQINQYTKLSEDADFIANTKIVNIESNTVSIKNTLTEFNFLDL